MREAVVSTHYDDAVLSCFSALNPAVDVITVLGGAPAPGLLAEWDAYTGATDSATRIRERQEEDRNALAHAGSTPVHLSLLDGQYCRDRGLRGRIRRNGPPQPSVDAAAAALAGLLDDAETVYAPGGIGNYTHVVVRDAVLRLRPDAILYADLPYALKHGFDEPRLRPARRRRDVRLAPEQLEWKLSAVACYATQVPGLLDRFGAFLGEEGLGLEVFWEVAR